MKPLINILLGLAIIGVAFWWSYDSEYIDFHSERQEVKERQEGLKETLENVDILSYDHPVAETLITPDLQVLDQFVKMIDDAQERVWIQIYIFTEKRLRQAVVNAHRRGVDVRVMLEPNVFGAPSVNNATREVLEANGVEIIDASNKLYTFTHSKLMLIDDQYVIGTGNLSYSSFKHNREFYIIGYDSGILQELENMFLADAQHKRYVSSHPSLILSPDGSREKLEKLLSSAETSITMYAQSLGDEGIKKILKQKFDEGVRTILYMGHIEKYPSNADDIEELENHGIKIETPKSPYIHAKAIFVDERIAYIGSINFTTNSIENNREVGVIIPLEK